MPLGVARLSARGSVSVCPGRKQTHRRRRPQVPQVPQGALAGDGVRGTQYASLLHLTGLGVLPSPVTDELWAERGAHRPRPDGCGSA